MVSPSTMASTLNANVVDLHSQQGPSDKKSRKGKGDSKVAGDKGSGVMEIRSRRIKAGELVLSKHFPVLETAMNLSLSMLIGLILRWVFGLIRSLRLSRIVDGVGGVCCSTFQGFESDTKSSFERLLACVLIKAEGDEAGKLLLTVLLFCLFVAIYKLAVYASDPLNSSSNSDTDEATKDEKGRHIYRRIPRHKVKRSFVLIGAMLSALWLFLTPSLLRYFGLFGIIEAAEELSARIYLLGNLIGVVSVPENDPLFGHSAVIQSLTHFLLTLFALIWGCFASAFVECIQESARNAAFVLSSKQTSNKNKKQSPDEFVALVNTRIMLIIQAVAPLVIVCTFFAERHFAEMLTKSSARGKNTFSNQYLQNSAQFVRVGLSWSFLGASIYTIRTLLQSYLDQASTVASAMSIYGENGSKSKQSSAANQKDPFSERYEKLLPTAIKVSAFPMFVFALLSFAHLRGGDVRVHPGVRRENVDALSVTATKGLSPGYSGEYATWIVNNQHSSNSLLQAASMSQSSWEETPFRDILHRQISDWFGTNKICHIPSRRAVQSMGRELHYMMLQSNNISVDDSTTLPVAINGPQLLEFAPFIPYEFTMLGVLFHKYNSGGLLVEDRTCSHEDNEAGQAVEVCVTSAKQHPSAEMIVSSILSHSILTPTIVIPLVETLTLLSSICWTLWYSIIGVWYLIKIRNAAGLHISA